MPNPEVPLLSRTDFCSIHEFWFEKVLGVLRKQSSSIWTYRLEIIYRLVKGALLSFQVKWLQSELEYLDHQIKKQEKILADCDGKRSSD
jgi:hypothetical protein